VIVLHRGIFGYLDSSSEAEGGGRKISLVWELSIRGSP
jgi:hypothetical protein